MSNHNRPTNAFVKGQPAMPGAGKPKGLRSEIEKRFGVNAEDAWNLLARIMNGTEESLEERVMSNGDIVEIRRRPTIEQKSDAAELVIAYLNGRPQQTARVAVEYEAPEALDDNALKLRVAEILARFATAAPLQAPALEGEFKVLPAPADASKST